MKLRIRTKLLLYILSTTLTLYIISFGYMGISLNKMAKVEAIKLTDEVASRYASVTSSNLTRGMEISKVLIYSFQNYYTIPSDHRDTILNKLLYDALLANPEFSAISVSLELSAIDSSYTKPYGRVRITYSWEGLNIKFRKEFVNLDGDNLTGLYYGIKVNQQEVITLPYLFSYSGSKADEILVSTVGLPIMNNGKFWGSIGFDVTLDRFKQITDQIKPYDKSYAFLVANNGNFVAFPDKKLINQPITKYISDENIKFDISDNIKTGKSFSFFRKDKNGEDQYVSFAPLKIGNSVTPWAIGIVVPVSVIMKSANSTLLITIIVGLLGLFLLIYIIYIIARTISEPLVKTTAVLKDLAKGDIDESKKMIITTDDEIGDIGKSVNSLIDGLKSTTEFAKEIGKGNLESTFTLLSEKDILGTALFEMRKSLNLAAEEDKKRKEVDRRLNWVNQGAAKFAEILRQNNDDMAEFSYSIISNLVKYISATQGGIFVINDTKKDNIFLELTASYAFDRRKILDKKIQFGVGLVGRCVQEGETIFMTNLPNDYINITSGLGDKNPACLLIVPLKYNEDIYAVVEIASFEVLEPYKIDFVERIGQSIASTIASVKITIKTAMLLEETKIQSEELSAQEEEMRQNMEEMQTTQEELERRASELNSFIEAVKSIALVIEYDMQGKIIEINDAFLRILNKTKVEMISRYQGSFEYEGADPDSFNLFWEDLRRGQTKRLVQHVLVGDRDMWFSEAYTPIYNSAGTPFKVLNIAVDISESIRQAEKFEIPQEIKKKDDFVWD